MPEWLVEFRARPKALGSFQGKDVRHASINRGQARSIVVELLASRGCLFRGEPVSGCDTHPHVLPSGHVVLNFPQFFASSMLRPGGRDNGGSNFRRA